MKKFRIFRGDKALWVVFFLLSVVSLIAVFSSIGLQAYKIDTATPQGLFLKHLAVVLITYTAIIILSNLNYRLFSRYAMLAYVLVVGLLVVVFAMSRIGGGEGAGSGQRWLKIAENVQMQPSEIAKVVLIIVVARMMTLKKEVVATKGFFWNVLIYIAAICVLVFFENFSTAALIFLSCYLMMYLGGVNRRLWWLGLVVLTAVVGIYLGSKYLDYKQRLNKTTTVAERTLIRREGTWGHRIYSWLNPNPDEVTQENQARMAVARGGLLGQHVGSTIHGRLMGEAHNDFIYAIIIEETGFVGGFVVFALYAILYLRCIRIAKNCKGRFGKLSVAGIGTAIYIQALVNMGVAVGALPVTGQTLPFISFGGTAYLFLGCGIGVVQAVASDNAKQQMAAREQGAREAMAESETVSENEITGRRI